MNSPNYSYEQIRNHVYAAWTANPDRSQDLTQVAMDIWVTNCELREHTDSTKDGCVTYGLILLNELNLHLNYQGTEFSLNPGKVYLIDARHPHSAVAPSTKSTGLFASLIWDLPTGTDIAVFRSEAEERVAEWLKETPVEYSC